MSYYQKKPNKVSYGDEHVMGLLKTGVVETLLLSDGLEDDKIEEFEEQAKQVGSKVRIISTDTREGVQLREMGKVAAILRFEQHQ